MPAALSSTGAALARARLLSCAPAGSVAPARSNPASESTATRANLLMRRSLASLAAREQSRPEAQLECRGEERDLGHRLGDPVVDRHGDGLGERHHEPLQELVVVGSERVRRQVLAYVAVRRLVEVGARREEAREEGQPPRPVAAFLAELPLRGRLGFLARLSASARQLPGVGACQMAELADEEHGVSPEGARGQPPGVLAQRQLAEPLQRRRAEEVPRVGHGKPPRDWPPGHGSYLCYCPRPRPAFSPSCWPSSLTPRFPQSQADILTGSVSGIASCRTWRQLASKRSGSPRSFQCTSRTGNTARRPGRADRTSREKSTDASPRYSRSTAAVSSVDPNVGRTTLKASQSDGTARLMTWRKVETWPTMTKLFQSHPWPGNRILSESAGFSEKRRTHRSPAGWTPATGSPAWIQP